MKYNLKFQKWKHVHNLDFYSDLKHLYTVSSKCKRKYRQGTMTFGPPRTHNGTHTHTHTHTLNGSSYRTMTSGPPPRARARAHTHTNGAHTHTHTHTQWLQLPPNVDTHLPHTSHLILNLLSSPRPSPVLYPKPSASASFQEI